MTSKLARLVRPPEWAKVGKTEIRFKMYGCANRRWFQIGVCPQTRRNFGEPELPLTEVFGMYDPMPNEKNEKLVSLDLDRFTYWLGQGARVQPKVADLLGLCGVLPLTPNFILEAANKRSPPKEDGQEEAKSDSTS